ncbi:MAG TPA: response regulator, partial [Alphaproteobacteria bacterium]|nr:response regulator [Alphaproteobacteria bacterium]
MTSRPATGANETARILLIDRNRTGMDAIANALGACLKAEVRMERAASGKAGADHLRTARYALVLLDLASLDDVVPSTEEAVARLVKLAEGALCIALSEGVSVSAAVAAMRAGAHDFVAKPVHAEAFSARLAELARRHGK